MQIDRLLQIVLILLEQRQTTARKLADQFEVSTRTIYRDIDTLSLAGVPVCSTKGNGGGISLMESYTLHKTYLTACEQKEVLYALQSLHAAGYPTDRSVLRKMASLFRTPEADSWIEIDFAYWGSSPQEGHKFELIRDAILARKCLSFSYQAAGGDQSDRVTEPLKLYFKGQGWYLYAYCRLRGAYRSFRVSRMWALAVLPEAFTRLLPTDWKEQAGSASPRETVPLQLRFHPRAVRRVYDDFAMLEIKQDADGHYLVAVTYPLDQWVLGYLLSYGGDVEVLSPGFMRERLLKEAEKIREIYAPAQI